MIPPKGISVARGVSDKGIHFLLFFSVLLRIFLSRYLTHLVDSGALTAISSPHKMRAPTHFLYADDVLLFFGLLYVICKPFWMLSNFMDLFQVNMLIGANPLFILVVVFREAGFLCFCLLVGRVQVEIL